VFAAVAGTPAPAVAAPGDPVYAEQPQATWTVTGGQVYAMARLGSRVVIGGTFTGLRSPAGITVARSRIAVIDAGTGAPEPAWNPGANGTVRALATDGVNVFAGGAFTTIGGVARANLASLSGATGAVNTGFQANGNGEARSLLLHNGKLYAGGLFTTIRGSQRVRLAAVSPTTGVLDTAWRPTASWAVNGIAAIPGTSTLALGGEFATVSGQPRRYVAAVNQSTGAVSAWAPAADCVNTANPCIVRAVVATSGLVYAAVGGPGGRLSAYDAATSVRRWSVYGDGDVQCIALVGGTVFAGGHFDPQFGPPGARQGVAAMDAVTGMRLPYAPSVTGASGVWAMLADADGLRIGGSFTAVAGDPARRGYAFLPPAPPAAALRVPGVVSVEVAGP
jgi:hypothetical protein